jgi:hypothetical protein
MVERDALCWAVGIVTPRTVVVAGPASDNGRIGKNERPVDESVSELWFRPYLSTLLLFDGERLQPGHQINRSHDGKCLETMVVSMSYERR